MIRPASQNFRTTHGRRRTDQHKDICAYLSTGVAQNLILEQHASTLCVKISLNIGDPRGTRNGAPSGARMVPEMVPEVVPEWCPKKGAQSGARSGARTVVPESGFA